MDSCEMDMLLALADEASVEDKINLYEPNALASHSMVCTSATHPAVLQSQAKNKSIAIDSRKVQSTNELAGSQKQPQISGNSLLHIGLERSHLPLAATTAGGYLEKLSGVWVTRPLVSSLVVKDRLLDVCFKKLSQIKSHPPTGSWATLAIVTEKKQAFTKDGQAYSRWQLSDLEGTQVSLMMWRDANAQHFKEDRGSVFIIYTPKVQIDTQRISVSVEKPEQVQKIGTSRDLGTCLGTRKDGQRCNMAVNLSKCEYCPYHAEAALKRMRNTRPDVSGSSLFEKRLLPVANQAKRGRWSDGDMALGHRANPYGQTQTKVINPGLGSTAEPATIRNTRGLMMVKAAEAAISLERSNMEKSNRGKNSKRGWRSKSMGSGAALAKAEKPALGKQNAGMVPVLKMGTVATDPQPKTKLNQAAAAGKPRLVAAGSDRVPAFVAGQKTPLEQRSSLCAARDTDMRDTSDLELPSGSPSPGASVELDGLEDAEMDLVVGMSDGNEVCDGTLRTMAAAQADRVDAAAEARKHEDEPSERAIPAVGAKDMPATITRKVDRVVTPAGLSSTLLDQAVTGWLDSASKTPTSLTNKVMSTALSAGQKGAAVTPVGRVTSASVVNASKTPGSVTNTPRAVSLLAGQRGAAGMSVERVTPASVVNASKTPASTTNNAGPTGLSAGQRGASTTPEERATSAGILTAAKTPASNANNAQASRLTAGQRGASVTPIERTAAAGAVSRMETAAPGPSRQVGGAGTSASGVSFGGQAGEIQRPESRERKRSGSISGGAQAPPRSGSASHKRDSGGYIDLDDDDDDYDENVGVNKEVFVSEAKARAIAHVKALGGASNAAPKLAMPKTQTPMTLSLGFTGSAAARSALGSVTNIIAARQAAAAGAHGAPHPRYSSSVHGPQAAIPLKQAATSDGTKRAPKGGVPLPCASQMAAAFGSVVAEIDDACLESRYASLQEDKEFEELQKHLDLMAKKDEIVIQLEATKELQVNGFHCRDCGIIREARMLECREHDVVRISCKKRFWKCLACGNRFTNLGCVYPKQRCPKCQDPNREFQQMSMYRGKTNVVDPMEGIAAKENFMARGVEHGFSLKS